MTHNFLIKKNKMYPSVANTAEKAAVKFKKLMKTRPGYWAENMCDSIEKLTDGDEQVKFLLF